ncbi:MAG: PAS domain-containing protein, partial [Actinomycetota bacterium]|nr:PAS domain-containing protein [Actinomycetota bacterium]
MNNGGDVGDLPGRVTATVPDDTLALLAAVLSNAPFGFALVDTDLRYLHINEPLAALNARAPEDHVGLRPADISEELDMLVGPVLRHVIATGESIVAQEFTATPPADSKPHDWLFSAYPVADPAGTPIGVAVAVVDVTDRRVATYR